MGFSIKELGVYPEGIWKLFRFRSREWRLMEETAILWNVFVAKGNGIS